MSENVKGLVERLRSHHRLDIVDFDLYLEAADLIEQQAARIAELDALLCAPPVAWIQPDHLAKAIVAPFLCRVEPSVRCDLVPIYRAPVADKEE